MKVVVHEALRLPGYPLPWKSPEGLGHSYHLSQLARQQLFASAISGNLKKTKRYYRLFSAIAHSLNLLSNKQFL